MRYFPSAPGRRMVAVLATGLLALGAVAGPLANADDDLSDKKKHVEQRIDDAQSDLGEASNALRKAQNALDDAADRLEVAKAELSAVRDKLADARIEDARLADRLAEAETRLVTARAELVDGRQALAAQRVQVRSTVTSLYEQGDPQLLAFASLMNADSPADLTRRQELNGTIVGRETQVYDDLDEAEQALALRAAEVEAAKVSVAAEREAAAERLAELKRLTQQAVAGRETVRGLYAERLDARRDAMAAKAKDRALLAKLRRQEARIRAQILAASRRAGEGVSASADGYLLPPVTGPITSPYGYRIHPIYGYYGLHDGTDFGVSCGEGMRAAGTGTVISESYSSVYGNRLYLSLGQVNGKNLTVVYNHASSYVLDVGDRVQRGDIVGYVGNTGWSTGCHLHFTVLVDGTAVDPENWL
ncbi:MAG: peptidoglycan DD-metalloendopeptidase family protein [Actinobacteria bacterium]|uniref:Unannotated protein n=1 Tax=freshwater metagenome TaxID=449393 RepID=A0A6J6PBD4_9ZZZZ|nr:peptidoglycan DD-metalloendopeptidase family protein [Actinomycetota bacterium]